MSPSWVLWPGPMQRRHFLLCGTVCATVELSQAAGDGVMPTHYIPHIISWSMFHCQGLSINSITLNCSHILALIAKFLHNFVQFLANLNLSGIFLNLFSAPKARGMFAHLSRRVSTSTADVVAAHPPITAIIMITLLAWFIYNGAGRCV